RGSARLHESIEDGELKLVYEVFGGDPFGFEKMPLQMTSEQALRLTADSTHPDALMQLAQLFRSPRTGDMVVSAAAGHDLRERYERPEHRSSHGALHDQHMSVPLAISEPLTDGPLRTADVFSMVTSWIGVEPPDNTDGVSRLAADYVESPVEAEVAVASPA
ncbi:MAG: hypothetical protein ACPHCI_04810, partial [Solirubrobacterales bacterium]